MKKKAKKQSQDKVRVHVTKVISDGKQSRVIGQYSYTASNKKGPRKDAAQTALSIVERVTGGKLKG